MTGPRVNLHPERISHLRVTSLTTCVPGPSAAAAAAAVTAPAIHHTLMNHQAWLLSHASEHETTFKPEPAQGRLAVGVRQKGGPHGFD
jgi:hypothetical protein